MIDFINTAKSNEGIIDTLLSGIREVIESGQYVLGDKLRVFEKKIAEYCGTKYAVGVNSGTDALSLCLRSLRKNKGEVITVGFTFPATVMSILSVGFTPIFVDVDETGTMDPSDLELKLTDNTVAIVPVHFMGHVCNMNKIMSIANRNGVPVIEDACQALGGTYMGKSAGSFGLAGCFSFFPTKNLSCIGDGGAITTNNENLYGSLILLRNFGRTDRESFDSFGLNTRLDEIQAFVLTEKLKYLDSITEQRRGIALRYTEALSDAFTIVHPPLGGCSSYHLYVIRVENNEKVVKELAKKKIDCRIHYSKPCHKQPFIKSSAVLPYTDRLSKEVMSLPIGEYLEYRHQKEIINGLLEIKHAS